MRYLLSLALVVLFAITSHATHIIGGELYYDHLGGDQYQVYLKLYRDCGPGNANNTQYDAAANIGVFGGDGSVLFTQTMPFPGADLVPVVLDNPCLTAPPTICVELAVYTGVFTLPARPDGYHLTYQRCCRTPTIINVPNANELGLTCTVRIPGSERGTNSAARFEVYPPIVLCLNEPLTFDHSATDPDGDELVYELCTPFNGGTAADPIPVPSAPPYAEIPWGTGYSEGYPMDTDPAIAIDPNTGLLTLRPTLAASYTVGIRVKEFRGGVLLSETRRDFRFDVVPCQSSVTAAIAPQTVFCEDLTVDFDNVSPTGQIWAWNFGDPATAADTSSLHSPSWTYSAPGTYNITLMANPGLTCADTTEAVFNVYLQPDPSFALPGPVCSELVTELVAEGIFGPDAVYQWDLGVNTLPPTASTPAVNAQFPTVGVTTVSLTVSENGCTGVFSGDIAAFPPPTAFFSVSPPSPQSYGTDVQLQDGSNANGGTIAEWAWYANGTWIGAGQDFVWNSPVPGVYDVELRITSVDGCTSIYNLPYEIIEVPIDIPNVFSPNGDGKNEQFSILNIEQHKNVLKIFNRWGMAVYEANNYRNNWTALGVPDGTYYYELVLQDGRAYTGHLTLLR
ncbi:MAG: gliding motility-associated C-terminal domain-containing protein [Flavobacteriales bacterium]